MYSHSHCEGIGELVTSRNAQATALRDGLQALEKIEPISSVPEKYSSKISQVHHVVYINNGTESECVAKDLYNISNYFDCVHKMALQVIILYVLQISCFQVHNICSLVRICNSSNK